MPDFSEVLKKGSTATSHDQKIFKDYREKKISLRECFEWFMKNNKGYVDEKYWNPKAFEKWIHSLGY